MSESPEVSNNEFDQSTKPTEVVKASMMPLIVYILYLVGFALPLAAIAGVILAHVSKKDSSPMERSHFENQVSIFVWGLVALGVGVVLSAVFIGYLVIIGWFVWTLYKVISGLVALNKGQPAA